ncbi:MAG: TetR/AcrR family transcriptional regulator [Myxococcota bacterium]
MRDRPEKARQIQQAAEEMLEEGGLRALSAQAIARRAGVNKALLFYYWGSTEALLASVLEDYYARHKASLMGAFDEGGDLGTRLRRFVDRYCDWMETHRAYARVVQEQVAGGGVHLPIVARHFRDIFEWSANVFEGVLPEDGPLSVRHFHLSFSAAVINYFTYAATVPELWDGDPYAPKQLAERRAHLHWLVETWLAALDQESPNRPRR